MTDKAWDHEPTRRHIKRALISVSDKTGLVSLGRDLARQGVAIVSTGSTARTLVEAGVAVTEVATVTGFPECLDGRVKTLHPRIHAGILADRRKDAHVEELADLGIEPFDLVVVNLYPFAETVESGATPDQCVEQIDIGGPTLLRAAAKNYASVAVISSPRQYDAVREALMVGGFTLGERHGLARQAFLTTWQYDQAVKDWFAERSHGVEWWPRTLTTTYAWASDLRYGENPHQRAALYVSQLPGLAQAEQLGGKAMSYNNYTDTDAAYRACYDFAEPAVAIVKHANPCGIAVGDTIAAAHAKAHACDPVSAYGGVVAANREVSVAMAEALKDIFTEVVVAPGYEEGALAILKTKKNLRLLVVPPYEVYTESRPISGGVLVQTPDRIDEPGDDPAQWTLQAGEPVGPDVLADLAFAWRAVRAVKSNAILLAHDGASVGVGMGQVNRVDSCRLAVERAGTRARGAVAASDAFFPFADGPQILLDAGVTAIVEPGGSIRDDETIAACQQAGVALYFTGVRHFAH